MEKVERAISFWKPILFDVTRDGRQLNGIEAMELGDEKKTSRPDKAPFIAMCNLMALEGLKMMGDCYPTVEDATMLAFATPREQEVSDFWHTRFAPTLFQAEWAWKLILAVMSGSPIAYREIFENLQEQIA